MRKSTLRLFSLLVATLLCTAATWAQKALPYNYGFENDDLAAEGWTLQGATQTSTGIYNAGSSVAAEGSCLFRFNYNEDGACLVSPKLSGTENGVEVSFQFKQYSSSYVEHFKVGYATSETVTDASAFTFGQELSTTTDWQLYENSFPAGTKYIAIQYVYSDAWYLYLDDFQFSGASGCAKPANLASSNVLTTSALLTWSGNASQYELVVSDGENANTYIVNNDTAKALTGLTSNTAYAVRLRAICAAGDTSKMISTSFKTPCEDYASLTFSENFDDPEIDEMPDCWNVIKFGSYPYVYRYAYYAHSDTGSLYFYSSSSYNAVEFAILPPFQANLIPQARVQFFYKQASSSANFIVGTMSNPNDTSTFVAIKTLDHTSDYAQAKVDLADAPAGHRFIAIKYVATTSYASAYIDDIEVIPAPSCMEPTDLIVNSFTTSSATLSWTPRGEESEWHYVCVGADEPEPNWNAFQTALTESAIVTGLEPDSAYTFYLRSYCEDEDDFSGIISTSFFTGYCKPNPTSRDGKGITAVSFGTAPDTVNNVDANGLPATAPYYGNYKSMVGTIQASKTAYIDITYSTGSSTVYSYGTLIWVDWNKNLEFEDSEIVYMGTSPQVSDGTPQHLQASFVIPADQAAGDYVMRIAGADSYFDSYISGDATANHSACFSASYAVAHDYTLRVAEAPDCLQPVNLAVDTVGASFATLVWGAAGNIAQWQYALAAAGEEPVWEAANVTSNKTVTLNALQANTEYEFFVRSVCSADENSDSIKIAFLTECAPYAMPFADDNEGDIYRCMAFGNLQGNNSYRGGYSSSATNAHSGTYALYLNAYVESGYYSTNGDGSFAILPEMNFGEAGLAAHTLSFWAKNYSGTYYSYYDSLTVCVLINDSTYVPFKKVGVTSTYAQYDVPFTGFQGTGRIMLLATVDPASTESSRYGRFYVDDIEVYRTPTCKALQSISVSDVKRTSMILNLVPKTGEEIENVQVVYSLTELDAAALESANKILVQDTNKVLLGDLARDTTYYIYARVACGAGDNSEWLSLSQKTDHLNTEAVILVADGTATNNYVPVYGSYVDYAQHSQSIYPAEQLTNLIGTPVEKIRYYMTGRSSKTSWRTGLGSFQVGAAITNQASLDSVFASDELTNVYTGSLDASGTEMTITLNQPLTYTGGNLLIDFNLPVATTWEGATFYGIEQQNASRNVYGSNTSVARDFLPKIGFVYTVAPTPCPSVTNIEVELLGSGNSSAIARWETADADYLSGYDVIVSETAINDFAGLQPTYANVQGDSVIINGLSPLTKYYVYVSTICKANGHDEGTSDWAEANFTTLASCPAIVNLASELADGNAVSISWNTVLPDQELHFAYVVSTDSLDEAGLASAQKVLVNDTLAARIQNLLYEQKYYIYVASACGDTYSSWAKTEITTAISCAPVLNLTASRVESNLVVLSWNRSQFGKETQWQAGLLGIDAIPVTTDTTMAMIIGLQPDSTYTAYVKALCGNSEESAIASVQFTTKSMSACVTIGEGTTTQYYIPIDNFYTYSYSQQIFDASELHPGEIQKIAFEYASATAMTKATDVTIWMGHTTKDEFASTSDWVAISEMKQVYQGALNCSKGWNEFVLDTAFVYNGSDNLILAVHDNTTVYDGSSYTFYANYVGANKTLYYHNDNTACPADAPLAGILYKSRNNIQFCFEPSACPAVKAMKVADLTSNSAKVSWEPSGSETSWNVFLSTTELTDMTGVQFALVSSYVQPLAGLQQFTDYWYYVQPACGGDWNVIKFTTIATCLPPVDLAVTNITASSAIISWSSVDDLIVDGYTVAYGLADSFDLEDPTTYTTMPATNMTATLTGLEANAEYKVAVMRLCDATDHSIWSNHITFVTECSTILITDNDFYTEDFESPVVTAVYNSSDADLIKVPDCWKHSSDNSSVAAKPHLIKAGASYNYASAGQVLYFYGSGNGYAALPMFENDLSELQISFKYATESSSYGKLALGYITGEDVDYNTFTVIKEYSASNKGYRALTSAKVYLNELPATASKLVFRWYTSSQWGCDIDDVIVRKIEKASVTVPASGYTTFFHSENGYALPNEMQAYVFNTTDSLVSVFAGGDTIPANMPLILKAEAGDYNLMPADGGLLPNILNQLVGTDTLLTVANDTNYVFYQLGLNAAQELDSVGFYWLNANGAAGDNFVVPAHKAYLKVGKVEGQPDHYLFNASGASTGIFDIIGSDKAVKFFHNGHFYILHQGVIFDATGRKVDNIQ